MGKVKAWAEAEFEKSLAIKEQQAGFGVSNPRRGGLNVCGIDLSDEELATLDKEFCAWLDAYEASFGDNYGE
jgi:hypothetical protein